MYSLLSTRTANSISLSGLIPPSPAAFTHTLYLPSHFSRPLNPQTDNSWIYFWPLLQQIAFHCPDWYHPPLQHSPTLCIYHHISVVPSTPRQIIHELTSVHYYSKQHFSVRTDATLCCNVDPPLCIYHHISVVPSTPRQIIHEHTSVHYYSKQHFTVQTDTTLCCGVDPHFVSTITFQPSFQPPDR